MKYEFPHGLQGQVLGRVEPLDPGEASLHGFALGLDPGAVAPDGGVEVLHRLDVLIVIFLFHRHRR